MPAVAVIILKVLAGGKPRKERLTKGWSLLCSCFQISGVMREVKILGSKFGWLTIARTAPLLGLIATTAPLRLAKAVSAAFCTSKSRVREISFPDWACF